MFARAFRNVAPVARAAGGCAAASAVTLSQVSHAEADPTLAFAGSAAAALLAFAAFSNNAKQQSAEDRLASLEVRAAKAESQAFVFIKPHAVTDAVKDVVKSNFAKHGIKVVAEGTIGGKAIDEKMYIDNHYGAIAAKAVKMKPAELAPSDKAMGAFKKAFGMSWAEALAKGLVYNAADGCKKLNIDGDALDGKWSTLKRDVTLIKFGGGFYCGQVDGIFIINGFYMSMRGKYTDPAAAIHYLQVEWPTANLSWGDFRGKVLGATSPNEANPGSLRRLIFDDWKRLGLPALPDTGDNGVHASASPFEAMAERLNWCGATVETDTFGKGLLAAGLSKKTIMEWTQDPQVNVGAGSASLFDSLEDLSADDCLEKAAAINLLNKK